MSAEQRSLWDTPEPAEPDGPMEPVAPSAAQAAPRIMRVSDLNRRVRQLLDSDPSLADVWVEGEVSQPSFPPSGHCFFTLKDAQSQIRAVLFREELSAANVRPEHGMQVIVHGRLRAYEPQGVYQLYVRALTPAGAGDLHQRYEQLRAKLAAEGLFEDARKRPLPRWPRRIGVVTSPVGVVWRDVANVLRRRYPLGELVLVPTNVQGAAAARGIARALKRIYGQKGIDLVILARGGGSLEDLWSFNDEVVVRAIVAAPMPIIVGVGHESDVTLADFAADVRAPNPERGGRTGGTGHGAVPDHPGPAARPRLDRHARLGCRSPTVPGRGGSGADAAGAGCRRGPPAGRRAGRPRSPGTDGPSRWGAGVPGRHGRCAARALAGGDPGARVRGGPPGGWDGGARPCPGRRGRRSAV